MRLQTHVCSVFPTLTVAVGGELDMESGPCLRDQLTCMIRAIGPRLALDLTGVTFIDCSGLTALLTARKAAQAQGGWLRLVAVSRCVGRLVQITGLQDALRDTPFPGAPEGFRRPASSARITRPPHHENAGIDAIWRGALRAAGRPVAVGPGCQRGPMHEDRP
jgi:anti-sigma B factor antagonist